MSYVDGFVLAIPKENLEAYREMAELASIVWKEHGALAYKECVGDDLNIEGTATFPQMMDLKPDETVVFAWIVYESREERDRINAAVMKDPRLAGMGEQEMPFDVKRMVYGGFNTLVEA